MKAVILAGGAGTRLRPVTYEIPKPLVPVKKKPIINYLIELLFRHGIKDIGLLVSREHEEDFKRWQKAWADELSEGKVSTFYEEKPRGTFGGFGDLRNWLGNERFLLSNGDELKDLDLHAFQKFHEEHKPIGTIALVEVPNAHSYGVPILDGPHIKEFLEKPEHPPSNHVSSGIYLLEPEVFEYADFSKQNLMIEKDIFPKLAAEGKLAGYKPEYFRWLPTDTLEKWEHAIQNW